MTILTPGSWYYVKRWAALFGAGQQLLPTPSRPRLQPGDSAFSSRSFERWPSPARKDLEQKCVHGGQDPAVAGQVHGSVRPPLHQS